MNFWNEYWEGVVAILAVITAAFGAFMSYRTFLIQKNHNIKSLRPIISIEQFDHENCLQIFLCNYGIGPAIVTRIRVKKNGEEEKTSIFRWLPEKLPGDMNYDDYLTKHTGLTLKAGAHNNMLKIPLDSSIMEHQKMREKIRGILSQLTVEIDYKDVYENEMPQYVLPLDVYKRTDNVN